MKMKNRLGLVMISIIPREGGKRELFRRIQNIEKVNEIKFLRMLWERDNDIGYRTFFLCEWNKFDRLKPRELIPYYVLYFYGEFPKINAVVENKELDDLEVDDMIVVAGFQDKLKWWKKGFFDKKRVVRIKKNVK